MVDELPPISFSVTLDFDESTIDPRIVQSILGLLCHLSCVQTMPEGGISIQERKLTNGSALALKFRMSPAFNTIFRDMLAGQEPPVTIMTIERSPEMLITMLLAQKLAAQHFIKIWMQVEERGQVSIHIIFDTTVQKEKVVKESPLVLVIEDTKPIGLLMEMYLHMAGFRTMLASDGISGLEMAQRHNPDLITLDVMMPRKDGWQVLGELKTNPVTSPIPVIIISVLKDRQVGFEHGASDYLPKPVERQNLVVSAKRLTSPIVTKHRRLKQGLNSAVYISSVPVLNDSIAVAFPVGTLRYCETGSSSLLDDMLSADTAPDLILVDSSDHFSKFLSTIFRLRMVDAFDDIPLVVIGDIAQMEYLRIIGHEIIDGYYQPAEFTRDQLLRDLRGFRGTG